MFVLVALFCMVASPMVSDCHIVVTKELLIDRDKCVIQLKQISVVEARRGFKLSSAQCHSVTGATI